jgi:hypothetical protein
LNAEGAAEGKFERRRRKGFAECAEENQKNWFCIFASFAKPLRPPRSKICIQKFVFKTIKKGSEEPFLLSA